MKLAALVSVAMMLTTPAAASDDLRASFEARYLSLRTAMDGRDAQGLSALLAADFVSINVDGGRSDRAAMLAELKTFSTPSPQAVRKTTVLEVRPTADGAGVDQQYELEAPAGAGPAMRLVTRSTDHWIVAGKSWLLQRTATRDLSIFRDGVLMVHKTAA